MNPPRTGMIGAGPFKGIDTVCYRYNGVSVSERERVCVCVCDCLLALVPAWVYILA
jgi:hypothetical protein